MFFKNTKEESTEIVRLNDLISTLVKNADEREKDHQKEIENLEKDHQIQSKRKDAEVDVKISEATKTQTEQIAKLELENGNYKKEVEILTKAFENLGFDVKDMKDILNKLVDGIVSKNTINLVK